MEKLAEESEKIKKTRKKLKDRLESIDKKTTPQALEQKSQDISRWIARHAPERVNVKKDLHLFDKNQNPAQPSAGVAKVQKELAGKKEE